MRGGGLSGTNNRYTATKAGMKKSYVYIKSDINLFDEGLNQGSTKKKENYISTKRYTKFNFVPYVMWRILKIPLNLFFLFFAFVSVTEKLISMSLFLF